MVKLNYELGSKYSFKKVGRLEEWKVEALSKNDESIFRDMIESNFSNSKHERNVLDDFFMNSTDSMIARYYILDENKNMHVKYIVYNKLDSTLDYILVSNIHAEDVETIETIYSNSNREVIENLSSELEVEDRSNIDKIKELLGKNSEKVQIITDLNSISSLFSRGVNVDFSVLDTKFKEIVDRIGALNLNIDLTSITNALEELKNKEVDINISSEISKVIEEIKKVPVYNDTELKELINGVKDKVNLLENYSDVEIKRIMGLIKEKVDTIENYDDQEVKGLINGLNVKLGLLTEIKEKLSTLENYNDNSIRESIREINSSISRINVNVDFTEILNEIKKINANSNVETVDINPIIERLDRLSNYNDAELKELVREVKSAVANLSNYNDSEIRGHLTVIINKLEGLAAKNVDLSGLETKVQEIKESISNINVNVDLDTTNDKIDNAKSEILGAISNINVSSGGNSGRVNSGGEMTERDVENLVKLLKGNNETTIQVNEEATMLDVLSERIDHYTVGSNRLTFKRVKRMTEKLAASLDSALEEENVLKRNFNDGVALRFKDFYDVIKIKENYGVENDMTNLLNELEFENIEKYKFGMTLINTAYEGLRIYNLRNGAINNEGVSGGTVTLNMIDNMSRDYIRNSNSYINVYYEPTSSDERYIILAETLEELIDRFLELMAATSVGIVKHQYETILNDIKNAGTGGYASL